MPASFDDLIALKGKPDIGEQVNVAIRRLADANELQGIINNADFDDPDKLGKGKVCANLRVLAGSFIKLAPSSCFLPCVMRLQTNQD